MTTFVAAPPKLTPDDLLRLPDGGSTELLGGRLVEKQVSVLSSEAENTIATRLTVFALSSGVARVFPGTLGYQCFPDDPSKIRKPDGTVIRLERIRGLADPNPGFMPIVPDLAIEVASTNDTLKEIDEKVKEYLDASFPLVWVADPIFRQLFVYPRGGRAHLLNEEDEVRCESALPGFVCKVSELFPPRA